MSRKLLKSLSVVSGFTFLSRILGFVRDVVIAQIFGASAAADAFLVAFKIPNFMRRLFAEGAFAQAFVPILSEYKSQQEHDAVRQFIAHVSGVLGAVLSLVTLVGVVAAPVIILLFAPGFTDDPVKYALAADMLQITFPYLLLISLTALAGAVLNAYGHFAAPAFAPVFLNLCLIGAALWWSPMFEQPVMALAWGALLAGVIQLIFQLPFLYRRHLLVKPRLSRPDNDEGVSRVFALMLPALFAVSVTQISLLIDTIMASFLTTGSIAWLYYSDRMLEFPIGIFGVALTTVMLPRLSRLVADKAHKEYEQTLDWSLRWVFLISVPCTVGLMVLAQPIFATLFYRGEFGVNDVLMSSRSLIAYTLGLLGFILIKILASGFFARQDTRTPMRIGIKSILVSIILNFIFILPLAHAGLALATACGALLNSWWLYRALRQQNLYTPSAHWLRFLLQIGSAALLMGVVLFMGISNLESWLGWSGWWRFVVLLGWMGCGVAVYSAVLWLVGLRPTDMVMPVSQKGD